VPYSKGGVGWHWGVTKKNSHGQINEGFDKNGKPSDEKKKTTIVKKYQQFKQIFA